MTPKEVEIARRRQAVAGRYLRGQTQWEIARSLEVNQATISRDLQAIQGEWLAQAVLDMDAIRARELAKVDAAEVEAWKGWERSQQEAQVRRDRLRGGVSETETTRRGQAGDPRFLELICRCVDQRCKILGVYSPLQGRGSDQPLAELTPQEAEQILADAIARLGG